ncbi:MAG: hypothetical protein AAF215_15295 [Cyanobacteria bacterium P01_A01_bin.123]
MQPCRHGQGQGQNRQTVSGCTGQVRSLMSLPAKESTSKFVKRLRGVTSTLLNRQQTDRDRALHGHSS